MLNYNLLTQELDIHVVAIDCNLDFCVFSDVTTTSLSKMIFQLELKDCLLMAAKKVS